jgi:hypothetical protein
MRYRYKLAFVSDLAIQDTVVQAGCIPDGMVRECLSGGL